MSVIKDIIEGSVSRDSSGWKATRVFLVEMSSGGNSEARLYKAALTSGIPKFGDPHPAIPGINVSSINVAHDERRDPVNFVITVDYSGDEAGTTPGLENSQIKSLDVQSSTVTQQTYVDHKGNNLIVVYKGPEFQIIRPESNAVGNVTYPYVISNLVYRNIVLDAEFEVPVVNVTVTIEKKRPSHKASIMAHGKVNSGPWSGLPAKTWLCVGIDSSKNSNGTFDWRYNLSVAPQFQNNKTWQYRAEPKLRQNIDGFSGFTTYNTLGNGIEFFDLYEPVNFRQVLGFSIPG